MSIHVLTHTPTYLLSYVLPPVLTYEFAYVLTYVLTYLLFQSIDTAQLFFNLDSGHASGPIETILATLPFQALDAHFPFHPCTSTPYVLCQE